MTINDVDKGLIELINAALGCFSLWALKTWLESQTGVFLVSSLLVICGNYFSDGAS